MKMKWMMTLGLVAAMMLGTGCGSREQVPQTPEEIAAAEAQTKADEAAAEAAAAAEAIPNPIPDSSPFAKIKYGMSQAEVYSILGQPTSQGAYVTGKAWIPFYFGGDKTRQIARYKGQGYIVFSQNHAFTSSNSVQTIFYDPNEKGFE